ncbi:MAG: SPOR domain-containing protein, partial [Alphaproteobacteria bacterium]|nr:SPOR domain-containing protein [Alphaproteobacteria bacterium]
EAVLPEATIESVEGETDGTSVSEDEVKKAEEDLEEAGEMPENVKPAVEKPEVKKPEVKKNVQQIKAPPKISATPVAQKKVVEKKTSPQVIPDGWQIQLAAVSSRESAESEWTRLSKRHPVLQAQKYIVLEKEIQGRTLYRLRVVGLSSRDVADKLCSELQSQGLPCLVMR